MERNMRNEKKKNRNRKKSRGYGENSRMPALNSLSSAWPSKSPSSLVHSTEHRHPLTFAEFFSQNRFLVSEKHEIPLKKVGALNEVLLPTLIYRLFVSWPLMLLAKNFLSLWREKTDIKIDVLDLSVLTIQTSRMVLTFSTMDSLVATSPSSKVRFSNKLDNVPWGNFELRLGVVSYFCIQVPLPRGESATTWPERSNICIWHHYVSQDHFQQEIYSTLSVSAYLFD